MFRLCLARAAPAAALIAAPSLVAQRPWDGRAAQCRPGLGSFLVDWEHQRDQKRSQKEIAGLMGELPGDETHRKQFMQTLIAQFNAMDKNMHGSITRGEWTRYMAAHGHTDPEVVKHLFDIFDQDGNGRISFREFVVGVTMVSVETPEARAYVLLKLCDENNDNKIDEAELTHQLVALIRLAAPAASPAAVKKKAAAVCALVFAEADANHDGFLSGDEINRFLRSRSDTAALVLKLVHNIGATQG